MTDSPESKPTTTIADTLGQTYLVIRLPRLRWSDIRFSCLTCRAKDLVVPSLYILSGKEPIELTRERAEKFGKCIVFEGTRRSRELCPATLNLPLPILGQPGIFPLQAHLFHEVRPIFTHLIGEPLAIQTLDDDTWNSRFSRLPDWAPWE